MGAREVWRDLKRGARGDRRIRRLTPTALRVAPPESRTVTLEGMGKNPLRGLCGLRVSDLVGLRALDLDEWAGRQKSRSDPGDLEEAAHSIELLVERAAERAVARPRADVAHLGTQRAIFD